MTSCASKALKTLRPSKRSCAPSAPTTSQLPVFPYINKIAFDSGMSWWLLCKWTRTDDRIARLTTAFISGKAQLSARPRARAFAAHARVATESTNERVHHKKKKRRIARSSAPPSLSAVQYANSLTYRSSSGALVSRKPRAEAPDWRFSSSSACPASSRKSNELPRIWRFIFDAFAHRARPGVGCRHAGSFEHLTGVAVEHVLNIAVVENEAGIARGSIPQNGGAFARKRRANAVATPSANVVAGNSECRRPGTKEENRGQKHFHAELRQKRLTTGRVQTTMT